MKVFCFGSGYDSVAEGVTDLNNAITKTFAGDNLVIFGVSQSAMIASLEEQKLAANDPADLGHLHFAWLAGPDNPMGGLFERFAGLDNPVVNHELYAPARPTFFDRHLHGRVRRNIRFSGRFVQPFIGG